MTQSHINVLALILLSLFSSLQLRTLEQREKILAPKVFKSLRGETLPYRLFTPLHYDQKKKYPLVVYLHGGGGRGNDNLRIGVIVCCSGSAAFRAGASPSS